MNRCLQERQLSLAPNKCKHLAVSHSHESVHKFFIDAQKVSSVCRVKDLGVLISNDLKWASHISYIHNAATSRAYQILGAFSSCNVWTLLHAFTAYVRAILKYNSSVWSPYLETDIALIESVQKSFLISFMFDVIFCLLLMLIIFAI